jgi:hypothetical protein
VPRSSASRATLRRKSHYDLNPDQPLPRAPAATPRQPGAAPGERHGGRSHAAVPALLRKRTQPA